MANVTQLPVKKKMKEGVTSSNNLSTFVEGCGGIQGSTWLTKGLLLKIVQDAVQDVLVPLYACITTK